MYSHSVRMPTKNKQIKYDLKVDKWLTTFANKSIIL